MHILFVSYSYWPPDFGGELLLSIERYESLVERGHTVTVYTAGKQGLPPDSFDKGIHIKRSPFIGSSKPAKLIRLALYVVWLSYMLTTENADAAHYGSLPGFTSLSSLCLGLWLALLLKFKGIRTVNIHSLAASDEDTLDISGWIGNLRKAFLSTSDTIVAVAPTLYTDISDKFPHCRTVLVPNAIREDIFVPLTPTSREYERSKLNVQSDEVVFTFLGTACYRKGFDLLSDVFLSLAASYPRWRLLVIGPVNRTENQNVNSTEFELLMEPLLNNPNVIFTGRVNDRNKVSRLLGCSDVFVFPSRREGFPLAPMEAMATGVPAIITRIPGVTDQVMVHGESGLYIRMNSKRDLASAMILLGTNEEVRKSFGQHARQNIVDRHNWRSFMDRYEEIFKHTSSNKQ